MKRISIALMFVIITLLCYSQNASLNSKMTHNYQIHRYEYFNMINNPIEGNLPLEYSYQIEVTQHPSFYKVRAHNNVFDFLNNIQRHSTSRELDNCEFTIFVNSEVELKLDDKEEVITQLQANISQLKNTNDSIDLKLIKTMEEYIESNNSLEYDLLKAVINQ